MRKKEVRPTRADAVRALATFEKDGYDAVAECTCSYCEAIVSVTKKAMEKSAKTQENDQ